ncbi:MAG: HAD-IA family hydrolase [Alphaproteobacteria bacterium]|nr:HAD-IA family hydrolase [Alphaproteobacteria bacterium]
MKIQGLAIAFDLDGTLVDTAPDLTAATNAVLARAGRRRLDEHVVRHLVGRGARALIEAGFAHTGAAVDPASIEGHVEAFLDFYGRNLSANSRPFPGVRETLQSLQDEGALLSVCTNKPHPLAMQLLAELELLSFFDVVIGARALPFRKPDPRHLLECITRSGGDKAFAVMVGDSETDVAAARNAAVPVILVDFGYTAIPAAELGGDALISQFDALLPAISGLQAVS